MSPRALSSFRRDRSDRRIILSPVLVGELLGECLSARTDKVLAAGRAAVWLRDLGCTRFAKDIPELLHDDIETFQKAGRASSFEYPSMGHGHLMGQDMLALLSRCASSPTEDDLDLIRDAQAMRRQSNEQWNSLCNGLFAGVEEGIRQLPRDEQRTMRHNVEKQQRILTDSDGAWWATATEITNRVLAHGSMLKRDEAHQWRKLKSLDAMVRALWSYALNIRSTERKGLTETDRDDAMHLVYATRCNVFVTSDRRLRHRARLIVPHTTVLAPDELLAWVQDGVARRHGSA